jgi:hypothetical protein
MAEDERLPRARYGGAPLASVDDLKRAGLDSDLDLSLPERHCSGDERAHVRARAGAPGAKSAMTLA